MGISFSSASLDSAGTVTSAFITPHRKIFPSILASPGTVTDCTGLTGGSASITSGYIRSTKLTASASFTVDKIRATLSSVAGNVKFSIYSDDSNSPNALLATTGSKTAVDGENDYDLSSSYEVVESTAYWISIQASDEVDSVSGGPVARANAYAGAGSLAFATTPNPYPSPSYDTNGFQFCITNE
tara:strand:+ start:41 stop:595 length:555 start_codon:yes stop_codon:yes gene_type:complete